VRRLQIAEYARKWGGWSALLIAFVVYFGQPVLAQDIEVVHVDQGARTVHLSFWSPGSSPTPALLYRATLRQSQLWNGQVPPVLREGVAFRASAGTSLYGDSLTLDLGPEASRIYHPDDSEASGSLRLEFDNVAPDGEPCSGKWEWNGGKPECVNSSPEENRLGDAWQQWSDREKLTLLSYLYYMHVLGVFAIPPCRVAQEAGTRHRCPPDIGENEYEDPIVAVAHSVSPPPALPDRAEEYLLRANSELKAAKSPDDVNEVISDYDEAVTSAPWWANAYYNRARAEAVAGLYLWAIADYERFLKLNPSPADAEDVRAKIAQLAGSD
jgi:hypothetical protein